MVAPDERSNTRTVVTQVEDDAVTTPHGGQVRAWRSFRSGVFLPAILAPAPSSIMHAGVAKACPITARTTSGGHILLVFIRLETPIDDTFHIITSFSM